MEKSKKITTQDVKKMIIREFIHRTGIPYYGDEHHEAFDFSMAPYENFQKSVQALIVKFQNDIERDNLTSQELQYLKNNVLERIEDAISYAFSVVDAKKRGLEGPEDENL